jgi:hypothetical protein
MPATSRTAPLRSESVRIVIHRSFLSVPLGNNTNPTNFRLHLHERDQEPGVLAGRVLVGLVDVLPRLSAKGVTFTLVHIRRQVLL